ncbi:MAG: class I SAM-dependent DNA methyltransferase [Syntrophobacteraceae bacterium]
MKDFERAKIIYDAYSATSYEDLVPTDPGYGVYADAIRSGCRVKANGATVLDLGCGTGRWFHCLENIRFLVGVDASRPMLAVAHNRLRRADKASNGHCFPYALVEADIHNISFAPGGFDFIYSTGVLGEYVQLNAIMLKSILMWLSKGGIAFLTIVESNYYNQHLSSYRSMRNRRIKLLIRDIFETFSIASSTFSHLFSNNIIRRIVSLHDYSHFYMTEQDVVYLLKNVSYQARSHIFPFHDRRHLHLGMLLTKF